MKREERKGFRKGLKGRGVEREREEREEEGEERRKRKKCGGGKVGFARV